MFENSEKENKAPAYHYLDYRIAQLKRYHPSVAIRLMDGEFSSISEAERVASIRESKKPLRRFDIDIEMI